MGKFEIGIILIVIIVTLSIMTFEYALVDKGLHNETCIIQDKYENEYTQLQPMPAGKGMMLLPITEHDYYFNTTKGVIPVNSKEYNSHNISDTLNVSVNDKGRVQVILN